MMTWTLVAGKRRVAGQQLVEHRAERVNIRGASSPRWPSICSGDM